MEDEVILEIHFAFVNNIPHGLYCRDLKMLHSKRKFPQALTTKHKFMCVCVNFWLSLLCVSELCTYVRLHCRETKARIRVGGGQEPLDEK